MPAYPSRPARAKPIATALKLSVSLAAAALAAFVLAPSALAGPGDTTRVSVDSAGVQGNNYSRLPTISANGRYVAFESVATNLVSGDTNDAADVFVRDRQTGTTERVSVDSAGNQANDYSYQAAISADGRFVAFSSPASNLVPGDATGTYDVFVHDRQTGTTERVSVDSAGNAGNDASEQPAISADGRFVAFRSDASNFAPADTNGVSDVFVRDRLTGTTERVSVDSAGNQGNNVGNHGGSVYPTISADGRFVGFSSDSSNLVPDDTNGPFTADVFVHDRQTGTTERVSVDSAGNEGAGDSSAANISADGRFVAFHSDASNLVPDDTNGRVDAFVHDRQTDTTERVSVDSAGNQGNNHSFSPTLSADGRFVAFFSSASNLVAGDTNGSDDAFVRDRQSGTTERVSVDGAGGQANGVSEFPAIGSDGSVVVFGSDASNLVPGDTNGREDVFVHERSAVAPPAPVPASVTLAPPDAVNPVSTSHTVTATVDDASNAPLAGVVVRFTVSGSVSTQGSCTTAADGTCTYTYTGPDFPGADQISAYADSDGNGTKSSDEPAATPATKAWILPTSTAGQVTGGGQIPNAAASDKVAFGFTAKSDASGLKGECTVVDPSTNTKVKCLNVTSLTKTATHATFYGDAQLNGQATSYRIEVDDLAEPGAGKDTFKLTTSSGYLAGGVLKAGNVQVH